MINSTTQSFISPGGQHSNAWAVRFLGVGNAQSTSLGSSSCVLESKGRPLLLIDCGPDTLQRFRNEYGDAEPPAVFITHTHFDHVGGLEGWFYRLMTCAENTACSLLPRLFVPVTLLPILQRRVADYPNLLAEGGANFWDTFQLIPVSDRFWLDDLLFDIFPVRHHEFGAAFGIALQGQFLFSGDSRPIPEILVRYASRGERIFHDCGVQDNPSHTALNDICREYTPQQWRRMVFYHYGSEADGKTIQQAGFQVALPGGVYPLTSSQSNINLTAVESVERQESFVDIVKQV